MSLGFIPGVSSTQSAILRLADELAFRPVASPDQSFAPHTRSVPGDSSLTMAYGYRSFQRGYRRPYRPYQRQSRGLRSSQSVHKHHEMREFGPAEQDPLEEGLLKLDQGFTGNGAGHIPTGDADTNRLGGHLLLFSPTARMPSTSVSLFPETLRLSQRYSTNVFAKAVKETVYIRLSYDPGHITDSETPNMSDAGQYQWIWRRIVIRTKLGGSFKEVGSGTEVGGLYNAQRLVQGTHVRPVIPVAEKNIATNVSEHLFRDHAERFLEGFVNATVDTEVHSVLYDKRTVLRMQPGGGRQRFDLYHQLGHMMEYDDEDGRSGYAKSNGRDAVHWGDVFIFDYFEQPNQSEFARISVDIPTSVFYWHERPI